MRRTCREKSLLAGMNVEERTRQKERGRGKVREWGRERGGQAHRKDMGRVEM